MNHRVKNLFSVVSAMVSIAGRESDDSQELANSLRNRIHALGKSHALTLGQPHDIDRAVFLSELIDTVVAPNLSTQTIEKTGTPLALSNSQITSLALVLHEWATNATKYGALSVPSGQIEIAWQTEDNMIKLTWIETGQMEKPASDPSVGFGTGLISAAARQLGGSATGECTSDGYRRTLTFEDNGVVH
ncbi:sensor histidine kinase [Litorisediminicola beolgyonensis]